LTDLPSSSMTVLKAVRVEELVL